MGVLRSVERAIRALVVSPFGRLFAGAIHPAEVEQAVLSALRESETVSSAGRRAANVYYVGLSPADRVVLGEEDDAERHLARLVREAARAEGIAFAGPVRVQLRPEADLARGAVRVRRETLAGTPVGRVRILRGVEQGRAFLVDRPRTTLGRGAECEVRLPDAGVSRAHAAIRAEGDAFHFEDLGSTNGSHVNRRRVERAELSDGDKIELGDCLLCFERME